MSIIFLESYKRIFDTNFSQLYDARLMLNSLPVIIDPIRLADEGARLVGDLSLKPMRRLAAVCLNADARISIDLQFGRSAQKWRQMHGTITAMLQVACQRCLQGLVLELKAEPALILLQPHEREDMMPEEAESMVATKPVALAEIVEDELLLALPMIPMHAEQECAAYSPISKDSPATVESHPFARLRALKKRTDKVK